MSTGEVKSERVGESRDKVPTFRRCFRTPGLNPATAIWWSFTSACIEGNYQITKVRPVGEGVS